MVVTWMLYCLATAGLLGAAATLTEWWVRRWQRPGRWVWCVAIAATLAMPMIVWSFASREERGRQEAGHVGVAEVVGELVPASGWSAPVRPRVDLTGWLEPLERPARYLWLWSSGFLIMLFGAAAVHLWIARRSWRAVELPGGQVRVSRNTGPAVVGVITPEIVLPRWTLDSDPETRAWILAHEREHVRAGDPALLMAGLVPVLMAPWNAALWWHFGRLRQAIEMDCDARVLRNRSPAERRAYGSLLLKVGRRISYSKPMLAAFADRPNFLERRIRSISEIRPSRPAPPAALTAVTVALLVVGAAMPPGPERPVSLAAAGIDSEVPSASDAPMAQAAEGPRFTPYEVKPELLNAAEVSRALERAYPPLLRDAGIGGRSVLWFYIDERGTVREAQVMETSGHTSLDDAALEVAREMRFEPARNRNQAVSVWIQIPISFQIRAPDPAPDGRSAASRSYGKVWSLAARSIDLVRGSLAGKTLIPPALEPRPIRRVTLVDAPLPSLRNRDAIRRALARAYPRELRDRGIGGRASIWVHIDENGHVDDAQVNESSGHAELDRAAVDVAVAMEFDAERLALEEGPIWASLPINFTVK